MDRVKAKKHLGQHFLTEVGIADKMAEAITFHRNSVGLLEIGPGTGILTRSLLKREPEQLVLVEIDSESVAYLHERHPELSDKILEADFLRLSLDALFDGKPFVLVGNFPYNISSQILFKLVEHYGRIPEMVGMFQREVAQRIASGPGSKAYGILSVLVQTWYRVEYLFTVNEGCFNPPPKVKSGVIRLERNDRESLPIPFSFLKTVVKTAFGQRRKTLRNSLSPILNKSKTAISAELLSLRPERLTADEFIALAAALYAEV